MPLYKDLNPIFQELAGDFQGVIHRLLPLHGKETSHLMAGSFLHRTETQGFSGGAGRKGWAIFSMSAEQPAIKDNRIGKGLLKRLQFSKIFLRENDYHVQCGNVNQQSSEGPWEALLVISEASSPMILSMFGGSESLSSKPWGFPLC